MQQHSRLCHRFVEKNMPIIYIIHAVTLISFVQRDSSEQEAAPSVVALSFEIAIVRYHYYKRLSSRAID